SPTPKLMTSIPWRAISLAAVSMAIVAEGAIQLHRCASFNLSVLPELLAIVCSHKFTLPDFRWSATGKRKAGPVSTRIFLAAPGRSFLRFATMFFMQRCGLGDHEKPRGF